MISFKDFFKIGSFPNTKVKVNMTNGADVPIFMSLLHDEKVWKAHNAIRDIHNTSKNLEGVNQVITFAQYDVLGYGKNFFLFGGVYEVNPGTTPTAYNLTLLPDYQQYKKRLIVKTRVGKGWAARIIECSTFQTGYDAEIYEISKP